jgi:transposase
MPNSRPPYPPELRRKIVALYRAGRSIKSLAREFEPCANTISHWVRQADLDDGVREDGLTTDERDELRHLKRENKRLREEREILKKAAAWFARESDSVPRKGSSS